jgi:outer membrane receptor protein involved in Fe transport
VQALCQALIGNTTSEFSTDPNNYLGGRADGVILQVSSGNRDLSSEEGRTYTLGLVLTSPFESAALSNASLSLDYYHVKITDAIATVTAQSTFDLCFNRDGTSNPGYSIDDPNHICRNIVRDETSGAALQVLSQYENLGIIQTSGIDMAFDWRAGLADLGLARIPGNVGLNLSFTKLFTYKAQEFSTAPPLENGGTLGTTVRGALFDWRSVLTLRYALASFDVNLNWQHLPSVRNSAWVTDHNTLTQGAEAYSLFSLAGDWNINDNFAISGGIDNLFDRDPPRVGAGQIQTIAPTNGGGQTILDGAANTQNAGYYDVLGRRYFINFKMRF